MLVNDNTAECNVSREKKNYHETIYDSPTGIKETFKDSAADMKSRFVDFLKQAKNRVSDWSFRRNSIAC